MGKPPPPRCRNGVDSPCLAGVRLSRSGRPHRACPQGGIRGHCPCRNQEPGPRASEVSGELECANVQRVKWHPTHQPSTVCPNRIVRPLGLPKQVQDREMIKRKGNPKHSAREHPRGRGPGPFWEQNSGVVFGGILQVRGLSVTEVGGCTRTFLSDGLGCPQEAWAGHVVAVINPANCPHEPQSHD